MRPFGDSIVSIRPLRLALILSSAICAASLSVGASAADPAPAHSGFTVGRQELGRALLQLARASGRNILFSPDLVRGKTSAGVTSASTFEDALKGILAGSGLTYALESDGSITGNAYLKRRFCHHHSWRRNYRS